MQGDFEKLYAEKLDLNNNLANTDLEIERWKRKANSNQNEIFLLRGIVDQLNVEIERLNKNCIDLLKVESWGTSVGKWRVESEIQHIVGADSAARADAAKPWHTGVPGHPRE